MSKKASASKIAAVTAGATAPLHPGQHVRKSILAPKKLTVLAAAKLVGVGRPAFSNFLNGHVGATPDMASRIEHAFGVSAQYLLDMQAAFDAAQTRAKGVPSNTKAYVVPFLAIKAVDIENWIERSITARIRLSVFLRTLVNSTGIGLTNVDFPGNDDAQRPGWDGYVETQQPTPWIPEGLSGWEFGTNQDIKGKADSDFTKSVSGVNKADRDQTIFIFVTPRHWSGKADWVRENREKGLWKDVRAYDSSDLEQWLEQSIAAQAWFANEIRLPSNGVRSLDKSWSDWADVAAPPLAGSLFAPAIEAAKETMVSRLSRPSDEPIIVAADSVEEALAFLSQLFGPAGGPELERYRDRVLVFDEPGILPKLAQGAKHFVAVVATREVERELGPISHSIQTIVVYPRNATNADPHIVLEPLNYEGFRSALEGMGYSRDDVTRFSNESGRSLTVLRRRLSTVPAVRTPEWAQVHETAASLIPFLFIGAWNSTNTADQTAVTLLANAGSYEDLEKQCRCLVALNDAPLWSVDTYRGVISKIDLLFAVAGSVTPQDLKRYFELAKMVLGEDEPSLDLPADERWAASIRGLSREFSAALREGISETLVLLAVHGNHLFRTRLGFDCESAVSRLVRELLTPLKTRVLEANDRDLSAYAEAAPEVFLSILEEDLSTDQPESYGLMRPAQTGVFGYCPRTGLLWALEGLAWNPVTLPRAALILAQLAEIEIADNWSNKPISSLESIFRAWMPQTAADHNTRLNVVKLLADRFPKTAWTICLEQLDSGQKIGHHSHKPSWRNEGHGFGEPFKTWGPIFDFMREMADMALAWKGGYSREMLCDLIQHLYDLHEAYQAKVWELVSTWAASASDADKAFVREKIRVTVMSRRGVKRSKKPEFATLSASAKSAYQALEPSDLLNKHEWLFRKTWVEESADELEDDDRDYRKRDERISKLRVDALREVFESRGSVGIFDLAEKGESAHLIGVLMVKGVLTADEIPVWLLEALLATVSSESVSKNNLASGALNALDNDTGLVGLLRDAKRQLADVDFARLLLLAPFRRSIWHLVDELEETYRQNYWSDVAPNWYQSVETENIEAVERLLAVRRPRAAFAYAHYKFEALGPELLFRLMSDIVKEGNDQPGHYRLDQFYVGQAFVLLDKSPVLSLEQKAGLEFAYIDVLSQPWGMREGNGIPNLEKYVEQRPELFVQAIVWTYKRKDGGEDPPEFKIAPDQTQNLAGRGYKLLEGLTRIPGHDDANILRADRLAAWIKFVLDACAPLGRLEIAKVCIGRILSGAPGGEDGVWPCEPVRQVMEDLHSKSVMEGARTGRYNSRGPTWRGEGGGQERELAKQYRTWANTIQYSFPFVASQLLLEIVKMYEHEASHEDAEAGIRKRLR